jgi:serine/threonine protein phosphatase 1
MKKAGSHNGSASGSDPEGAGSTPALASKESEIMSKLGYIAVGDIHGDAGLLEQLLEKIESFVDRQSADRRYHLIYLGDYIDRGPESEQVVDIIMGSTPKGKITQIITLMGNHEEMFLNDAVSSYMNGGRETLLSYGVDSYKDIPVDHKFWYKNLEPYYETENYFFCHAGVEPGIPPNKTHPYQMMWIRNDFLRSDYDWGKIIIHGHTPVREVEIKPNRINIDTAAVFEGMLTAVVLEDDTAPQFLQVKSNAMKLNEQDVWLRFDK